MISMHDFVIRAGAPEPIGYKGENLAKTLEIITDSGPEWAYRLEAKMGGDAYIVAALAYDDGILSLPLSSTILQRVGTHTAQVVATRGEVVRKSSLFLLQVSASVSASDVLPPEEPSVFEEQIRQVTALVAQAQISAGNASDSEAIAAAEALSARASAIRAETFAQKAEEIVEGFSPEGGASGGYNPPEDGIPLTDLSEEVQAALQKAETALQSFEEADPTVPAWAKSPNKPTYTAAEVGALPVGTPLFSGDYNDLENKPTIPEAVTDEHINSLIDNKIGIIDSALQGMIDKAREGLNNG